MTDSPPLPSPAVVTVYSVTNWNALFENNRSRTVRDLSWVSVPNKHDGEKYSLVMQHKKAAELFAAWVLLLQVASRCQPRGRLVRTDGSPYDAASLALRTRAPAAWFNLALPYFARSGWLTAKTADGGDVAPGCQAPDGLPSPARQAADEGGKEKEGRERKRNEGENGSVSPADVSEPNRARMLAVNALKHRQESTRWSAKEFSAYTAAGLDTMPDADFAEQIEPLATYYAAPAEQLREHWRAKPGDDFRRRDLLTLLNNWPGEVDRARAATHWLAKNSEAQAKGRL